MLTKSQMIAVIALKDAIRAITEAPENEEKERCDTDWSKVPKGTLVEVRDSDLGKWIPGYFWGINDSNPYPYRIFLTRDPIPDPYEDSHNDELECGFIQCRLYEGPGALVWQDWSGDDECPVPEGKQFIVMWTDKSIGLYKDGFRVLWDQIIKYCIIDPPQELPDAHVEQEGAGG